MIHGESCGFDQALDVVETLPDLPRKLRGNAAIGPARSLAGKVQVASGFDARRAGRGGSLRLRGGRKPPVKAREKQREPQQQAVHAGFPFCAALNIERKRWPTIISSPGWMVMETISR